MRLKLEMLVWAHEGNDTSGGGSGLAKGGKDRVREIDAGASIGSVDSGDISGNVSRVDLGGGGGGKSAEQQAPSMTEGGVVDDMPREGQEGSSGGMSGGSQAGGASSTGGTMGGTSMTD